MPKTKTVTRIKQLAFSPSLIQTAERKAQVIGVSTPEYVRYLIIRDNEESFRSIVTYPANLPPEIETAYDKEAEELEQQIQRGEAKEYKNMADLIKDMEAD